MCNEHRIYRQSVEQLAYVNCRYPIRFYFGAEWENDFQTERIHDHYFSIITNAKQPNIITIGHMVALKRQDNYKLFVSRIRLSLLITCMLVCTWDNFALSLHFPSTKSHVHISPLSDELTRKLLSWMIEAGARHSTGAVWPTSRHLGVIFNVSGSTFL